MPSRGILLVMFGLPAASAIAACLALAACGGGDPKDDSGAAAATPATATAPTTTGSSARAASSSVRLASVGTFDTPVYVTAPPGDRRRIFVVEQGGRIRVLRAGKRQSRPFLD